ncbi:MAG: electron transport complex subunit RsxG [Sulfuritalea sp.]|jgi:electron transport complex protein RnfG|nr:electron transport complex subunit RsxG [Sulfuritalea sp.]
MLKLQRLPTVFVVFVGLATGTRVGAGDTAMIAVATKNPMLVRAWRRMHGFGVAARNDWHRTCEASVKQIIRRIMNVPDTLPAESVATVTQTPRTLMHGVILGAFCLGFGLVLAITDRLTLADIAARALEDRQNSLSQVIPAAIHDNNPVTDTLLMKDGRDKEITVYRARKDGRVTGVAYEIYGTGYAGEIRLMLGVAADGKLLGVRVLAHKETPGLGDKIEVKKGDWILRFSGLSFEDPPPERWKVKKDGGQFDQFAGATITPRGVLGAIRSGLEFFAANKAKLTEGS